MTDEEKMALAKEFFDIAFPEKDTPEMDDAQAEFEERSGWEANIFRNEDTDDLLVVLFIDTNEMNPKPDFYVVFSGYDAAMITLLNLGLTKEF